MKSRIFLARFLKIISIAILSVVAMLVLIVYILKPCIYNYERYKIRENLRFPENIRNIYYVGDIKIDNPLIACINDRFYVFESETLNKYDGCDSVFINRDDVIWLSPYNLGHSEYFDKHNYLRGCLENDLRTYLIPTDTVHGLPLYKFPYKPKSFMLTMVRKFERVCTIEPDVWNIKYINRDYIPSLCPRFTPHQKREIQNSIDEQWLKECPNIKAPRYWEIIVDNFLARLRML